MYPNLVFFHPKKIKGFLNLIKESTVAKKIKSFTLNNTILQLIIKLRVLPPNAPLIQFF